MVSSGNDNHPTCLVKLFDGIQSFPNTFYILYHKSCVIKRIYFKTIVRKPPHKNPGPAANQKSTKMYKERPIRSTASSKKEILSYTSNVTHKVVEIQKETALKLETQFWNRMSLTIWTNSTAAYIFELSYFVPRNYDVMSLLVRTLDSILPYGTYLCLNCWERKREETLPRPITKTLITKQSSNGQIDNRKSAPKCRLDL